MIEYHFNIQKVIQIINFLLKRNGGEINYTKLIKELYLSDRLMLKKYNDVITGDKFVNMNNGQVVSKIYNLIKNEGAKEHQRIWNSLFMKDGYNLKFLVSNNLNDDELSEAEIKVLEEIDDKFKNYSYQQMINYVHKLPEWKNPKNSSNLLKHETVLKALKRSDEEINYIKQEVQSRTGGFERLLCVKMLKRKLFGN